LSKDPAIGGAQGRANLKAVFNAMAERYALLSDFCQDYYRLEVCRNS
jgi:hypothetical protein